MGDEAEFERMERIKAWMERIKDEGLKGYKDIKDVKDKDWASILRP
jgi:hypothetical protein